MIFFIVAVFTVVPISKTSLILIGRLMGQTVWVFVCGVVKECMLSIVTSSFNQGFISMVILRK